MEEVEIEEEITDGKSQRFINLLMKRYQGKIVTESFKDQRGRVHTNRIDFYFEYAGKKWFIKLIDSEITKENLVPYIDKTIEVEAEFHQGLWDTNNLMIASRVGEYVVILHILI